MARLLGEKYEYRGTNVSARAPASWTPASSFSGTPSWTTAAARPETPFVVTERTVTAPFGPWTVSLPWPGTLVS